MATQIFGFRKKTYEFFFEIEKNVFFLCYVSEASSLKGLSTFIDGIFGVCDVWYEMLRAYRKN